MLDRTITVCVATHRTHHFIGEALRLPYCDASAWLSLWPAAQGKTGPRQTTVLIIQNVLKDWQQVPGESLCELRTQCWCFETLPDRWRLSYCLSPLSTTLFFLRRTFGRTPSRIRCSRGGVEQSQLFPTLLFVGPPPFGQTPCTNLRSLGGSARERRVAIDAAGSCSG